MKEYISFDSHKHYTLMERETVHGGQVRQRRIEHRRGAIRAALADCETGNTVAVEAMGSWYWIIEEIEAAGLRPCLVHPRKAKLMMGQINKTDKLDVHGLNRLQRNGTLPTVWIPPAALRDLRELSRTRLMLVAVRTRLKNRLTATLTKHGRNLREWSDAFGPGARAPLCQQLRQLPTQTRLVSEELLAVLDFVGERIQTQEQRLAALIEVTPVIERLMSLPGVGLILGSAIAWEVGEIERFASAERLASYAGTTPRVAASGDKTRYGRLRPDTNRYLKWAYVEAANVVALQHRRWSARHVAQLYGRIRGRKGHAKAIGAVARHLAEATWHIWNRGELYREPPRESRSVPTGCERERRMSQSQ